MLSNLIKSRLLGSTYNVLIIFPGLRGCLVCTSIKLPLSRSLETKLAGGNPIELPPGNLRVKLLLVNQSGTNDLFPSFLISSIETLFTSALSLNPIITYKGLELKSPKNLSVIIAKSSILIGLR